MTTQASFSSRFSQRDWQGHYTNDTASAMQVLGSHVSGDANLIQSSNREELISGREDCNITTILMYVIDADDDINLINSIQNMVLQNNDRKWKRILLEHCQGNLVPFLSHIISRFQIVELSWGQGGDVDPPSLELWNTIWRHSSCSEPNNQSNSNNDYYLFVENNDNNVNDINYDRNNGISTIHRLECLTLSNLIPTSASCFEAFANNNYNSINTTIKSLELSYCNLGDHSDPDIIILLVQGLCNCHNLHSLYLAYCLLRDDQIEYVVRQLLSNNDDDIISNNNNNTANGNPYLSSLQILSLAGNRCFSGALQALNDVRFGNLKSLDIADQAYSEDGRMNISLLIPALTHPQGCRLKELDLSFYHFWDHDVRDLVNILQNNQNNTLEVLDLNQNDFVSQKTLLLVQHLTDLNRGGKRVFYYGGGDDDNDDTSSENCVLLSLWPLILQRAGNPRIYGRMLNERQQKEQTERACNVVYHLLRQGGIFQFLSF